MKVLFVAGTGTDVGKTFVTARLAGEFFESGVPVGVYKPVASGCTGAENFAEDLGGFRGGLVAEDALTLWKAAGRPLDLEAVCPQRFAAPLAPDEAARRVGKQVNEELLFRGLAPWKEMASVLLIEGAGGLFSPLSEKLLNIDFYRRLGGAELILVAANQLGVIHQVVSTVRAAEHSGVTVSRLFLNATLPELDSSATSNADQIRGLLPDLNVTEVAWKDENDR